VIAGGEDTPPMPSLGLKFPPTADTWNAPYWLIIRQSMLPGTIPRIIIRREVNMQEGNYSAGYIQMAVDTRHRAPST